MRIGIIGHFGGQETFNDGQTVKVLSLYNGLKNLSPKIKIQKIDTYYFKRNKFKLFCSFLKCLLINRKIIFLPATNGRQVLFKLLYHCSIIFKKKIYHNSIGGHLPDELVANPVWIKYLNSFQTNWMESVDLAERLKELGVKNASYLPNFKPLKKAKIDISNLDASSFSFCIFSRIMPEKGIEEAVDAINALSKKYSVCLDIYGPVDDANKEWFAKLCESFSSNIHYKGCVDSDRSVETICDYYCLLFPTRYYTEGMPGTIIDAMFAGLPVIARRWAFCDQMITDSYNGLVYDFDCPENLLHTIERAIKNIDLVKSMKKNCLIESEKYDEKNVIKTIASELNVEGM